MLPKPINPQTLPGLKVEKPSPSHIYETAKATIDAHNQLIAALGPGASLSIRNFSSSPQVSVTEVSGTVKRGKFTALMGTSPAANSTITMNFPSGSFSSAPFSQVTRNGGNGASSYTYNETASALTITLASPSTGETYIFQFVNQE